MTQQTASSRRIRAIRTALRPIVHTRLPVLFNIMGRSFLDSLPLLSGTEKASFMLGKDQARPKRVRSGVNPCIHGGLKALCC